MSAIQPSKPLFRRPITRRSDRRLTHIPPSSSAPLLLQSSSLSLHYPRWPFIILGRKLMDRSATSFVAFPQALKTTVFRLPVFLLVTMCTADAASSPVCLQAIFHLQSMTNLLLGMALLREFVLRRPGRCSLLFERLTASTLNARYWSFVPSLLFCIWA